MEGIIGLLILGFCVWMLLALCPHSSHSLSNFPDETHPDIGGPDCPSVPHTRIGGNDGRLDDQGRSLLQKLVQNFHWCSLHGKGYGEGTGVIQRREATRSLGVLPRQRTVMEKWDLQGREERWSLGPLRGRRTVIDERNLQGREGRRSLVQLPR